VKHPQSKPRHLTAAEIERLIARKASAAEYRRAVRHLLTGCRRCALTVGALGVAEQFSKEAGAADYDQVFDAFERRIRALLEEGGQL